MNNYFQAIKDGDIKVVIQHKQSFQYVQMTEFPQDNGLLVAVRAKQHQIAKLLAPKQSGYLNQEGWSALHIATILGDLEMVNILLPFEFKLETSLSRLAFPKGSTVLDIALLQGKSSVTRQVIKYLYSNDCVNEAAFCCCAEDVAPQFFDEKDSYSRVLSHYLAFAQSEAIVNRYLGKVLYQQQCQDKFGFTPLHYAVICNNFQYIQEVVAANVQCRAVFSFQLPNYIFSAHSALMIAVFNNNIDIVRLLLNSQAGFQNVDGFTALMLAAKMNHFDIATLLIDKESGLVTKHSIYKIYQGSSAIFFAEKHKNYEIVNLLLPFEKDITNLNNWKFNEFQKPTNLSTSQQIKKIIKQRSASQSYKHYDFKMSNTQQLLEEQGFNSSLYRSLQKEQEEKLKLQISGQLSHKFGRSQSQQKRHGDNFLVENIDNSMHPTQDSRLFNLNRKESVHTTPEFEQHSSILLANDSQNIQCDVSTQTEQDNQIMVLEKDCSLDLPYQKLMNIQAKLQSVQESCQILITKIQNTYNKTQQGSDDQRQQMLTELQSNLSSKLKLSNPQINEQYEQYQQYVQSSQQKSNQLLLSNPDNKKLVQSQSFHQFYELSQKFDEETQHLYQKYNCYVKQLAQDNCQLKLQQQNYLDLFNICSDCLKQFYEQIQNQATSEISRLNQKLVKISNFLIKFESKQQIKAESPSITQRRIKNQQSPLVHGQFDAGSMEMSGL